MKTVEASRVVDAPPGRVRHHLGPAELVENEGTFRVLDVTGGDGEWTVTASAAGAVTATFDVRKTASGYSYEQVGTEGPFDAMRTEVILEEAGEGRTEVTMRSSVSMGLPLASLTDRIAAWKRRSELERALDALAAEL